MARLHRLRRMARRTISLMLSGDFAEIGRVLAAKLRRMKWRVRARLTAAQVVPVAIDARFGCLAHDGSVADKQVVHRYPETAARLATVVIPCFNYGHFLRQAVNTARAQTLACVEIIVVDDGSTDEGTRNVLDEIDTDGDMIVLRKENGGLVSARNAGIAAARGEYICCLDADDRLLPIYLEMAVLAMRADAAVGFAWSWAWLFGDEGGLWKTRDFAIEEALEDNHTAVCAVFRRDDWVAAGGYDPRMREGYEDWEFWLRLAALGRKGKCVPAPLFEHRRHGHTMTHDAHNLRPRLMERMRALNAPVFQRRMLRKRIAGVYAPASADSGRLSCPTTALDGEDARPHVMVVLPWLQPGGAELVMLDILRGLETDWRITIATTLPDDNALWREFAAITSDIVPLSGAWPDDRRAEVFAHLMESRATRVVLSSGSGWLYENAARLRRARPALRIVDILHNALPAGHMANAIVASGAIDRHVAVAPHIATALLDSGIAEKKVTTVLNGVDVHDERRDLAARAAARAALGLEAGTIAVGWVGRLSHEKRPLDFVKLLAGTTDPKVHGFMCGEGPMLEATRAAAKAATAPITFLGRRSRELMAELYAALDVLVLTSAVEGLPLVVMEAMAAGCPVVATHVGDVALLISDGVNGRLVPVGDGVAMRAALTDMLADPARRAKMGANARRTIVEGPYSTDAMRRGYASLLSEMQ